MIDYLIMSGISKNTIDELRKRTSQFHSLELNQEECIKIITYLRFLGISSIDEILLYRPELFLCTKEEVVSMVEKNDIRRVIYEININYENIDKLFD